MEPFQIKLTLTEEDLIQHHNETRMHPLSMWFSYALLLFFLSLIPHGVGYMLMGFSALAFARIVIGGRRGLARALKNRMAIEADIGEQTYVFDDAGISLSHSKGQRMYEWPSITAYQEYAFGIDLRYFGLHVLSIPRRCFQDGQIEKLREALQGARNLNQEQRTEEKRITKAQCVAIIALLLAFVGLIVFRDPITTWAHDAIITEPGDTTVTVVPFSSPDH
jgi:YcxB-like protein